MIDGYAASAERFVASAFPGAAIAIMAGSTSRGERTATSDIDVLLIGDDLFASPEQTSVATTLAFEGHVFEVFGYTHAGFEEWAARDIAQHRPVIVNMLLDGIPIRADSSLVPLRARWTAVREAGPHVSAHEHDIRRYVVTDLLDDLRDAEDAAERHVIAAALVERVAQLMLLNGGCWIASGKHLPRALRAMDAGRADALLLPWLAADFTSLADSVAQELERAGGRLQTGFTR